jgi:hypothetical protein
MSTFSSTVTASDANIAQNLAEADARAQVAASLGDNFVINTSFTNTVVDANDRYTSTFTIDADATVAPPAVETPPFDEFAGVDDAVAAQAATPVDTFLDPQQQAEARDAALAEASAEANAASAADPVDAANDQSLQDQEDARQFAAAQPTTSAAPVNTFLDPQQRAEAAQIAAASLPGANAR